MSTPARLPPLHGVRILDMATVVAAPFSSTLCADLGAEVVKIELPEGGDALRTLAPVWEGHELFWKTGNRGKQGITLDVRKPAGRALLLRLLPQFDVLVENFRTGTLDKWGLDLDTLHQHNPRLIVLRVTGFGQTGPDAKRPGFARVFEAMSGMTHLTGEPDRPPQHMNYPLGDAVAGLFGAFSIAAALADRNRTPLDQQRGTDIDLSATEALIRLLDPLAAEHQFAGQARGREGSRATYTAPSNVYQSLDGHWVTIVGTGNAIFERIARALGQPELTQDPRFDNNLHRTHHRLALDALIVDWCRARNMADIVEQLERCEVPHSRVNSVADAMQHPHLQARQTFIDLPDPDLGSVKAPCIVPRFKDVANAAPATGPARGQHNASFFGSLGLSGEEMQRLRDEGVI